MGTPAIQFDSPGGAINGGVPDPAAWALIILVFCGIGVAMRDRQSVIALRAGAATTIHEAVLLASA